MIAEVEKDYFYAFNNVAYADYFAGPHVGVSSIDMSVGESNGT